MSCCSSRTSRDRLVSSGLVSRRRVSSSLRRRAGGVCSDAVPQRGRGVVQPQVHVAVLGEGGEHLQASGGEPAGAEDREPRRQVAQRRIVTQARAGVVEQLGRARRTERIAEPPPQLGLPGEVLVEGRAVAALVPPGGPGAQHLGPRLAVLVEHPRQPPCHREPPSLVVGGAAEVLRKRPAPRLGRGHRSCRSRRAAATPTAPAPTSPRPRRAPPRTPQEPRRPACSATGRPRWRRRRRLPTYPERATAAAPATARRPWQAPRRPRPRTGRRAAPPAPRPARGRARPRGGPGE